MSGNKVPNTWVHNSLSYHIFLCSDHSFFLDMPADNMTSRAASFALVDDYDPNETLVNPRENFPTVLTEEKLKSDCYLFWHSAEEHETAWTQ